MSQENVDVVRQAWEAFARRDNESVLRLDDPDVEVLSEVDGRTYQGNEVIAVMHERARAKRSGVLVARTNAHRWTLRNGKLWRLRVYAAKADALEAVGLRE
jgi:ketosteroid isomerase-like protein